MESLKQTIKERFDLIKHFTDLAYCVCPKCGREWKTHKVNGVKTYDLKSRCDCGYGKYEAVELINNADFSIPILTDLATAYRNEIHEYLAPSNIPDKEEQIRSYIRDIMNIVLPLVRKQKEQLEEQYKTKIPKVRTIEYDKLGKALAAFYQLEDDYTALAAFRHFETFVLYIDKIFKKKVFTPSLHLFKGFYYFANSMVLKKDVHFIEKQCFAGAGKSVTDCALMTWILGIDINSYCIKIFGNKTNIKRTMKTAHDIMLSAEYAKVFPYYAKFDRKETAMFTTYQTSGELQVSGSYQPVNILCSSKGENIDGSRVQYLFLDDITQSKDANNVEMHQKDIFMFNNSWFERKDDPNNTFIIASGTTYHQEDLLSYLKHVFGVDYAKPTKFKFTSISNKNEILPKWLSVFIVIYGLDENDKSTFEEKYPTEVFLFKRSQDYRMFMAMTQQQPLPPEGSPFDYDNLPNLYGKEGIPHLPDRSQEVCTASLDPARIGRDFHAMPIIVEIDGRRYFQDCICDTFAPDKLPQKVVDMIEKHHIVRLDIENNTDTTFDVLIKKLLAERGINYCSVTSFFSYQKKDQKIANCETAIKSVYYPRKEVYTPSSQMGKFMQWFTAYNYDKPPKHDDPTDSMANYSLRFIINKQRGAKVKTLSRRYA